MLPFAVLMVLVAVLTDGPDEEHQRSWSSREQSVYHCFSQDAVVDVTTTGALSASLTVVVVVFVTMTGVGGTGMVLTTSTGALSASCSVVVMVKSMMVVPFAFVIWFRMDCLTCMRRRSKRTTDTLPVSPLRHIPKLSFHVPLPFSRRIAAGVLMGGLRVVPRGEEKSEDAKKSVFLTSLTLPQVLARIDR